MLVASVRLCTHIVNRRNHVSVEPTWHQLTSLNRLEPACQIHKDLLPRLLSAELMQQRTCELWHGQRAAKATLPLLCDVPAYLRMHTMTTD